MISSLAGAQVLGVFPHIKGKNQREVVTGLASRISREHGAGEMLRKIGIV
jgi:hypothetical protein